MKGAEMGFTEENLKHPKRGGWYHFTIDGKSVRYPSITNILGTIDKSRFLIPWASKQCIEIACKEPWLTVDEVYSRHRDRDVIGAGSRGTGVHNIGAKLFRGEEPETNLYPEYVQPIRDFIGAYKPLLEVSEKVVRSDKYGIGGTLDLLLNIDGLIWLVDIKTSKAVYDVNHLQLGFYQQALLEEGIKVDKVCVLHLPGNGKFNIVNTKGNMDIVNNLKQVYLWTEAK